MPEEEVGAEVEAEMDEDAGELIDDATLDGLSTEEIESLLKERVVLDEEPEEEVEPTEPEPEPEPEEKVVEPEKEPENEPEPVAPVEEKAQTLEDRVANLESEKADLLEKFERQKTQLGRWSNEIGEMRRAKAQEMTDDEFALKMEENPREAIRMEQERLQAQADSEELEKQRLRDGCEESVRGQIKDFDDLMPDIIELARQRYKLADWGVDALKKDPFMFNESEVLDLARDAKLQRLEAKLAAAERATPVPKKSSGDLADKINRASKKPPRVGGGSGQGTEAKSSVDLTEDDLSDNTIDRLDEKALTKILKERGVPI